LIDSIQYWFFYPFNHAANRHDECDWELVSIKLTKSGENFSPQKLNFYQHYGGHTHDANNCWWSSSNSPTYSGIEKGYNEARTHLHIWITANGHASYNRYDPVHKVHVQATNLIVMEDYIDNVDYSSSGYDLYFEYDQLEKMGEFGECHYCEHHGNYTWLWHRMPIGNSKEWLAYSGRIGDYWTKIKPPEGSTSTPSPTSPGSHADWRNFNDNYSG